MCSDGWVGRSSNTDYTLEVLYITFYKILFLKEIEKVVLGPSKSFTQEVTSSFEHDQDEKIMRFNLIYKQH